jgi:hypothetical protein
MPGQLKLREFRQAAFAVLFAVAFAFAFARRHVAIHVRNVLSFKPSLTPSAWAGSAPCLSSRGCGEQGVKRPGSQKVSSFPERVLVERIYKANDPFVLVFFRLSNPLFSF